MNGLIIQRYGPYTTARITTMMKYNQVSEKHGPMVGVVTSLKYNIDASGKNHYPGSRIECSISSLHLENGPVKGSDASLGAWVTLAPPGTGKCGCSITGSASFFRHISGDFICFIGRDPSLHLKGRFTTTGFPPKLRSSYDGIWPCTALPASQSRSHTNNSANPLLVAMDRAGVGFTRSKARMLDALSICIGLHRCKLPPHQLLTAPTRSELVLPNEQNPRYVGGYSGRDTSVYSSSPTFICISTTFTVRDMLLRLLTGTMGSLGT